MRDFLGIGPKKYLGTKNYLFLRTSQLSGNFEGQYLGEEHDIDDLETALETTKGPLHRPNIS